MKRPIVTDFTETIYRADAYKYTQEQEKYIDYLEAQAEQLILSDVSQQRELLFCGGCGNKKQLIVETDINSQRVCKNKLCQQNNCG